MSPRDAADREGSLASLQDDDSLRVVDAARAAPPEIVPISSDALFGRASEVRIAHRGSIYRLKQTSLGKLILTK